RYRDEWFRDLPVQRPHQGQGGIPADGGPGNQTKRLLPAACRPEFSVPVRGGRGQHPKKILTEQSWKTFNQQPKSIRSGTCFHRNSANGANGLRSFWSWFACWGLMPITASSDTAWSSPPCETMLPGASIFRTSCSLSRSVSSAH